MTLGDDFINDELDTDLGQVEDVEDVEDEKHEEANQRSWWDEALHMDQAKSGIRRVFVIMPFSNANERSSSDLDHLFEDAIRAPMETYTELEGVRFKVERSASKLRINQEMLKDIARADYAIVDLSGPHANPNVMYELGVRLASSTKPVILIRERHPNNQSLFDVNHLHTYLYDPQHLEHLTQYILDKIHAFEILEEHYISPVLESLGPGIPFDEQTARERAIRHLTSLRLILQEHVLYIGNIYNRVLTRLGIEHEVSGRLSDLEGLAHLSDVIPTAKLHAAEMAIETLIKPPQAPIIENVLLESFLDGILPTETIEQFHRALRVYYVRYFGQHLGWHSSSPLLASIRFTRATLIIVELIKVICNLIDEWFTGPVDFDETRRGYVSENHIVFAWEMQNAQGDLNLFMHELFAHIDQVLLQDNSL